MAVKADAVVTAPAILLDDPKLMRTMMSQAKSSHSSVGRSLDVAMSHRQGMGGESVPPSVMFMNRRERERQLAAQKEHQTAWGAATNRTLTISKLATMAPSFTKAADEGVADLGGTRLAGAGYTTYIGVVPSAATNCCLDENCELVSSFRPYRYDAFHAERQAQRRDHCAPHPDLLHQLNPTLSAVCPSRLVDLDSLPTSFVGHHAEAARLFASRGDDAPETNGQHQPEAQGKCPGGQMVRGAGAGDSTKDTSGTACFKSRGRMREERRLPGVRQPSLGQYHPRYTVTERRVCGGYVAPRADTPDPCGATPVFARTHAGLLATTGVSEKTAASATTRLNGQLSTMEATCAPSVRSKECDERPKSAHAHKSGENHYGSSMFLSKSQRKTGTGTAAPDVCYWPYPDTRSTTKRVPCPVSFEKGETHRRREPPVSGVPTGAYDITGDIADHPHRTVRMDTATGRDAHWFGKRNTSTQGATDYLNLDAALAATRPDPKAATLPPRGVPRGSSSEITPRGANSNPPVTPDAGSAHFGIGGPSSLRRVRAFDKMLVKRDMANSTALDVDYNVETTRVAKATRAAVIHPRAPGHGDLHTANPTELGDIPDLRWVKPNSKRAAHLGIRSGFSHSAAPGANSFSYETERGYRAVEPRVTGNPMIGSVVSRQQRGKVFSTQGCGAAKMYDIVTADKVKSVLPFDKQITKESQFCGHRVQSERWLRNNPAAPGPGSYNPSYKLVE